MKVIRWNNEKNEWLKNERNLSFERVIEAINNNKMLDVIINNRNQKCFVLLLDGYPCLVPFVEDDEKIFLKTIIPSRKLKKMFGE